MGADEEVLKYNLDTKAKASLYSTGESLNAQKVNYGNQQRDNIYPYGGMIILL